MLLNFISGTYNNADKLLNLNMEDKAPFLVINVSSWSRVWLSTTYENWIFSQIMYKDDVGYMPYTVGDLKCRYTLRVSNIRNFLEQKKIYERSKKLGANFDFLYILYFKNKERR